MVFQDDESGHQGCSLLWGWSFFFLGLFRGQSLGEWRGWVVVEENIHMLKHLMTSYWHLIQIKYLGVLLYINLNLYFLSSTLRILIFKDTRYRISYSIALFHITMVSITIDIIPIQLIKCSFLVQACPILSLIVILYFDYQNPQLLNAIL